MVSACSAVAGSKRHCELMLRYAPQGQKSAHASAQSSTTLSVLPAASLRVAITTLGCKVNQYDSATIEDRLKAEGHVLVPFSESADVYIVNSCTVTNQADAESRQLARRAKRHNPAARIIMTGCYAQVNPKAVAKV